MALTALPTPRTPDSMDAPPLRWGILGTGWIADQFVGSLRRHTRQVIQAVGSRSAESAGAAAARWGAPAAYGSYAALVADPAVDVVYVATPHNFHLPHALLAIDAGKHVLVEKPVGLSAAEARAIHGAATAQGVFAMEAMWTLFLPKYDVIRQLLADGALGTIHSASADMGERFGPEHRIMRADLAGGPMLDLGTYPATFVTWVLGAGLEVAGAVGTPAPTGLNGQFASVLSGGADAVATISASILDESPTVAVVGGTEGTLWVERSFYRPGPFTVVPAEGTELRWQEEPVAHDALHFEAAEVARRISAGETGSPLRPFTDTIGTLAVMDAIRAELGTEFGEALAAREAAGG